MLRAVLSSTGDLPSLTAHPAAALGRVFHKLLEKAVRGEIPRVGTPDEDAERMLDRLLDDADANLASAWPNDAPQLRKLFPPLTWRRKRRVVLDLAEKYLSGAVPRAVGSGRGNRRASDLPVNGSWAEVPIDVPALRLRGRADFIQRTGGDVEIRDLKTGRVLTNEGEVLPHIERQMRLYGTMARVVWPEAHVSLVVDHGVEQEVRFSLEHEADVLTWLDDVLRQLPAERDVETEPLATPGEACEGCGFRHVCSAYRRSAPEYWRGEAPIRMPLDTWGELLAIAGRSGGLVDLTIRDAAGRTVKVFGLAAFHVSSIRPGDAVSLFGLRTRDKRGGSESWRHPHNFFEVGDDDPFARAWTLEVFTSSAAIASASSPS